MAPSKPPVRMRLLQMLERYRHVDDLHPALSPLGQNEDFRNSFERVIRHEFDVIKARSPDLNDHEITIAQKVFFTLMQNEDSQHGAVQIFIEELLGVGSDVSTEAELKIRDAVNVRAKLPGDTSHQNNATFSVESDDTSKGDDANLAKLENLCEKAKADLDSDHPGRYDRLHAARFLRDTVENTISYIQSNKLDKSDQADIQSRSYYKAKLAALNELQKEAAETAKEACFGHTRTFEMDPLRSKRPRIHSFKPRATSGKVQSYRRLKEMHGDRYRPV